MTDLDYVNVRKRIGNAMAPGASLEFDSQSSRISNSDVMISMAWAAKICPADPDLVCRALRVKWGLSENDETYLLVAVKRLVDRTFRGQDWIKAPVGLFFAGQLMVEFVSDSCRRCDGEAQISVPDPEMPGWTMFIDCPVCRGTAKCTTSDRARAKSLKMHHETYRRNLDTWSKRFNRARGRLNEIERKSVSRMKYLLLD